ncbi:hypothetical protein [Effusibacillus lacus]|uniref:Uncharacterized protein n=1 Tax=Effusibacillus lacus TaxID=1348429 RepID=A0A292YM49_9BACL|nr:hypothetical protein [Effusibacillus lacus]TCS73645.1 hypothetical protein EDD64_11758 [Effusibacillus lacus]GAX89464.1 hypothetical protein [Effusibacillus lacus]
MRRKRGYSSPKPVLFNKEIFDPNGMKREVEDTSGKSDSKSPRPDKRQTWRLLNDTSARPDKRPTWRELDDASTGPDE